MPVRETPRLSTWRTRDRRGELHAGLPARFRDKQGQRFPFRASQFRSGAAGPLDPAAQTSAPHILESLAEWNAKTSRAPPSAVYPLEHNTSAASWFCRRCPPLLRVGLISVTALGRRSSSCRVWA